MRVDLDTFSEILDTLTHNKSRSLLTAFGVFWGLLILVVLIGGANGLEGKLRSEFDGFATNSGLSYADKTSLPYRGFTKGRWWQIKLQDLSDIKKNIEGVETITGMSCQWGKTPTYNDRKYADANLKGLEACYSKIEEQPMKYGRFINEMDQKLCRKVVVLGKHVYEGLFKKGEDPCGKYIIIDGVHYCVIGVSASESGMSINGQTSESLMIPMETMQKAYNIGQEVDVIGYTAKSGYRISEIEQEIADLLKRKHYVHPADKQAVGQINAQEMFEMAENLFTGIGILTWIVGLGTLFAGIIGVSNIMMVTVKERTSEIGIRRAIGARPADILFQIVAECLLLTSFAGLSGLSCGVGILALCDEAFADGTIHYGFGITLGIGIALTLIIGIMGALAALAPAMRALSIKPIEAMREE